MKKSNHYSIAIAVLLLAVLVYVKFGKKKTTMLRSYEEITWNSNEFNSESLGAGFQKNILDNGTFGSLYKVIKEEDNSSINHYRYSRLNESNIVNKMNELEFSLPANAEVKFIANDTIFYYDRYGLYIQLNGSSSKVNPDNTSVYEAVQLSNKNILCFGEIQNTNSDLKLCFYTLNIETKEVHIVHSVRKSRSSIKASDMLVYAGKFSKLDDELSYVYERQGKILFFDNLNGRQKDILYTIDSTRLAETVLYGDQVVYKKGKANLSNSATIRNGISNITISNSPRIKHKIIADLYRGGTYQKTYMINFDKLGSSEIRFVYQKNNIIYFATKSRLYRLNKKQLFNSINI